MPVYLEGWRWFCCCYGRWLKLISHYNQKGSYLYFGRSGWLLLLKVWVLSMWSGPAYVFVGVISNNVGITLSDQELSSLFWLHTRLHWHSWPYSREGNDNIKLVTRWFGIYPKWTTHYFLNIYALSHLC